MFLDFRLSELYSKIQQPFSETEEHLIEKVVV